MVIVNSVSPHFKWGHTNAASLGVGFSTSLTAQTNYKLKRAFYKQWVRDTDIRMIFYQ